MSGRFAKGHIPSPRHLVGLGHPLHLSAVPIPPAASADIPPPVDQGMIGSCTGNSSAIAIQVGQARALGLPHGQFHELPSRLFLYYGARALEASTTEDAGAMIADIFEAAARLGFPPESAWPYPDVNLANPAEQLAAVVAQPSFAAYEAANDQKIVRGAHRILSEGQALADDVARAIAAGSLVVWGTELDQAFEDLQPGDVWPGVTGPVIGGHAMVLHAYEPWLTTRRYKTRSSWGDWCDGGSAWVSQAAITSPHASDFWVVDVIAPYSTEVA